MALTGRPVLTEKQQFLNLGRDFIRRETVKHALNMGLKAMED
jgi:nicotinamide-nucleotide amidase